MLKPGDTLVHKRRGPDYFGPETTSWKTALVVMVDHGTMPSKRELNDGRPACIWLLVTGPTLLKRDFSWVVRNYEHVEEGDGLPEA
jgi:hypothetical protein